MIQSINNISISFIIPYYNGKKYISQCIKSICEQDIFDIEYEILVINDCSTDNSLDCVNDLKLMHPNIKIINHTTNKKQGGARNTGIQNARGKYIWFIDQDDYIKKGSIKKILYIAESYNLEILQFCFDDVNEKGIFMRSHFFGNYPNIIKGIDYIQDMGLNSQPYTIWSRLYKRDFLIDNNFTFPEHRVIFEDYAFAIETMLKANIVKIISDSEYCYRINDSSTMQKSYKDFKAIYAYHTCLSCGIELIEISKKYTFNSNISNLLLNGGIWRINQFTKGLFKSDVIETNNFFKLIQLNSVFINNYISYFNNTNKFIIKNQSFGQFTILCLKPLFKLIEKFKCKKEYPSS